MNKEKKFYKNKYFWIITIVICCIIAPFLPSDNSAEIDIASNSSTNYPETLEKIVLSYGNSDMNSYIVGKDLSKGIYNITINNSNTHGKFIIYNNNNDFEIIVNETFGTNENNIQELKNIELKDGNLIEIYKNLIVKLELVK